MAELYFLDRGGNTRKFDIGKESMLTVGRSISNVLAVADPVVSATHAQVWFSANEGLYRFRDLGSSNGTWLNGELASEGVLSDSEVIYFGDLLALFSQEDVFGKESPSNKTGDADQSSRLNFPKLRTSWHGTPPQIVVVHESESGTSHLYPTLNEKVSIGRHEENDIVIRSPHVAEFQAKLRYLGPVDGWEFIDIESTEGTLVNGKRVQRHRLQEKDIIEFDGVQCWLNPQDQQQEQSVRKPPMTSDTELLARKLVTHSQLDARLEQTLGKLDDARKCLREAENQLETKEQFLRRIDDHLFGESAKALATERQKDLEPMNQPVGRSNGSDRTRERNGNGKAMENDPSPTPSKPSEDYKNGSVENGNSKSAAEALLEKKASEIETLKRELNENSEALWKLRSSDSDTAAALELVRTENALIERLRRERESLSELME